MAAQKGEFRSLPCRMRGVRAVAARSNLSFPRHMHDEFGIGLIVGGAQKSLSGRGVVEASAGDMITCNPGEVHDGAPIGSGGRSWAMLYFDPDQLGGALDDVRGGDSGTFEFELPRLRSISLAIRFRRLFDALTADRPEHEDEELLLELLGELTVPRKSDASAQPRAILRVRERIDDAPARHASLLELAAEVKLSRFQLLRGFRKATGLTPHAYAMQRRLQLARRLIGRGIPLAEAAAASGFADQSHMTRLFARNYGLSPSRFSPARN